jgi:hypothetical protein
VLEETIEGQGYRGHAGLRQYYEDLSEQGVESQGELTEYRDLGDQVLGLGRLSFKSATGVELDSEAACFWRWSDRLCVEARTYLDHKVALEAVGLSERAMSKENVEIVRRAIDAFNGRELEAWEALSFPDAEVATAAALKAAGLRE